MNVLVDYHHGNLYYSLYLLLEKRLGYKMFRPIGKDWLYNGYFRVAEPYGNPDDTVNQFLGTEDKEWNALTALNGGYRLKDDIYYIYDKENNIEHRAISFKKFKEIQFDLIVSSHPLHNNWEELLHFQPQAKYIAQLGNEGQKTNTKYVLSSISDFVPNEDQKVYNYHQEFDLTDYYYSTPTNSKKITSFVVSLPEPETFEMYKNALLEFEFKAYGVGSPDGTVHGGDIPQMMRESMFGWHIKPFDGYGHVIHKWFAVGRPVITRGSYYVGKKAGPLLEDGVTCIDLDKHTVEENVELIKYFSKPDNYRKMCENVINRFNKIVDFEREGREIRRFVKTII